MSGHVALILAGGVGRRLWPLSTPERPKPFRALFGPEPLAARVARQAAAWTGDPAAVWLSLGEGQLAAARAAVPDLDGYTLLRERRPTGTTAAIARAALALAERRPDAVLLVLAADQLLAPDAAALRAFDLAADLAARGFLVSLGVPPAAPSEAYGYMLLGAPLPGAEGAHAGLGFVEKPDAARAAALVAGGRCLWNAGVFAFRADALLSALARHAPGATAALQRGEDPPLGAVDHDLMEKVRTGDPEAHAFLDAGCAFLDAGTLEALAAAAPAGARDNRTLGDVAAADCEGCALLCEPPRRLHAAGLSGLLVAVGAEGGVLVAPRASPPHRPGVRVVALDPGPDGCTLRPGPHVLAARARECRFTGDPDVEVQARDVARVEVRVTGDVTVVTRLDASPRCAALPDLDLHVAPGEDDVAEDAAALVIEILAAALAHRGRAVLVPSTGRTVIRCYDLLATRHRQSIDWARVEVFQMDELDVPEAQRARRFLEERLLAPLGVAHAHVLCAPSATEAVRVERALLAAGADLVIHGLGENAHLGLNEPGSPFDSPARAVHLAEETRLAKRLQLGVDLHDGATLGLGALLAAPRSLLLATGPHKRRALAAALFAPLSPAVPASGLQRSGRVTVLADEAALPALPALSARGSAGRGTRQEPIPGGTGSRG